MELEEQIKLTNRFANKSKELQDRIDKAIEVLESKRHCERLFGGVEGKSFTEQALEILKGEE